MTLIHEYGQILRQNEMHTWQVQLDDISACQQSNVNQRKWTQFQVDCQSSTQRQNTFWCRHMLHTFKIIDNSYILGCGLNAEFVGKTLGIALLLGWAAVMLRSAEAEYVWTNAQP